MATLTPTGGITYCTVESGSFPNTYDGYTATSCCFKTDQTCLSEWYWGTPVNVTKFNILALYYTLNSRINAIWGRVNGSWVEVFRENWIPSHNAWDSKAISCNNCTGIRISQTHLAQASRPCIVEVSVDYAAEGKATIMYITTPDTFTPGVSFDMNVQLRNDGGDDKLFVRITNTDTGDVLVDYTTILIVPSGQGWSKSFPIILYQTTDFNWLVEAGHVED